MTVHRRLEVNEVGEVAVVRFIDRKILDETAIQSLCLNEIIPFPRGRFSRWWRSPRVARELLAWMLDLRRRRRVLRLFVSQSLLDDVSPRRSMGRPIFKFVLLTLGLASLVLALARPRWDPKQIELEQQGQNLLFCRITENSVQTTFIFMLSKFLLQGVTAL